MKSIWTIALWTMVTAPAWCNTVTLMQDAYVKGPVVHLAEIATIHGDDAEALGALEISTAAKPGSTRRIDVALLRNRLEHAGYSADDVEVQGVPRVAATTLHLDLDNSAVASNLRDYVVANMPWDPQDAVVDVTPPTGKYVLADGEVTIEWRIPPTYTYLGQGTFRGEIRVDGKLERTVYAKASVQAFAEVIVATRVISRGERITASNVKLAMQDLSQVKTGVYFGTDELEGTIAKSNIYAGQILSPRKVAAAKIVKRNQLVTVVTQAGPLTIESQAQAMSDGSAGDILTCRNMKSKEEFTGLLRKDGVVVVY